MSYRVKQIADFVGVSVSTIHSWLKNDDISYEDFLSPSALDTSDTGRIFTDDDATVFWTIQSLRSMQLGHAAIREKLKQGYRVVPEHMPSDEPTILTQINDSEKREFALIAELKAVKSQLDTAQAELRYYQRNNQEKDMQIKDLMRENIKLEMKIEELEKKLKDSE